MRWPWSIFEEPMVLAAEPVEHDPSILNRCPRCGHLSGLIDEHWTGWRRVTVCSPRCATTWLEATYRVGVPQ